MSTAVLGALAGMIVVVLGSRAGPWMTAAPRAPRPLVPSPSRRRHAAARLRRRRPEQPDEEVVARWCERVAAGVRSGSSLGQAVVAASATGATPFPTVVHGIRRGRPLGAAFRDAADDPSTPVGLAAPVLASCAELGGPTAGAIERVAAILLARAAEREERRAASAQARLSARVLTLVPLGVVALLALTEPSVRAALVTPAGAVCLVVGGTLDVAGWWWMRRMIGAVS